MKQSPCPRTMSRNLAHIALVCFLALLLIQSALGLFIPQRADMDSVDIVLRTAISSIFGYLMSSMGQKSTTSTGQEADSTTPRTIGFSGEPGTTAQLEQEEAPPLPSTTQMTSSQKSWSADNLQFHTAIIASLGLFCLSVLIFLHYYTGEIVATTGIIATIAQFRDIISGSIGALIGLARGHQNI